MLKGSNIFITGITGFLGQALIKEFYQDNFLIGVSRNENEQYFLKKKYSNVNFVIADIRDFQRLKEVSCECDIGIFGAAIKQIDICESNPTEAIRTNVLGAENCRRVALENKFEKATYISTDKACLPTTIYGYTKSIAESIFNKPNSSFTILTSVRYGNIMNSTGSVIRLIWRAIGSGIPLTLYHKEMTRFLLPVQGAVNAVKIALQTAKPGVVIPKLTSFRLLDLFELYYEKHGLQYKFGRPRENEKIHEDLISKHELNRDDLWLYDQYGNFIPPRPLKSNEVVISKEKLRDHLEHFNYYAPTEESNSFR